MRSQEMPLNRLQPTATAASVSSVAPVEPSRFPRQLAQHHADDAARRLRQPLAEAVQAQVLQRRAGNQQQAEAREERISGRASISSPFSIRR